MAGAGMGLIARGKTWASVPSEVEGLTKEFPDVDFSSSDRVKPQLSNMKSTCRLVKNTSGDVLLPKLTADYADTFWGKQVDALGGAAAIDGVIDEYVVPAGVPADHWFWLVIKGPVTATAAGAIAQGAAVKGAASGEVATDAAPAFGITMGECIEAAAGAGDVRLYLNPTPSGG